MSLEGAYAQSSCNAIIKISKQAAATTLQMLHTHAA